MSRCTATAKTTGERCKRAPASGREVCRMHGGASLRGSEHPAHRGRGYSKDLPTRLADRLEEALKDPELVHLYAELALTDARVGEVITRLTSNESDLAWNRLLVLVGNVADAMDEATAGLEEVARVKAAARQEAVKLQRQLEDIIRDARSERENWREIMELIEQRRKLAETERRAQEALMSYVTPAQMGAFIAALQLAIMEELEQEDQERLGRRIRSIMHRNGGRG